MCLNDTRSSASTRKRGYDVKQAEDFEPACSPGLGWRVTSHQHNDERMQDGGGGWGSVVETK